MSQQDKPFVDYATQMAAKWFLGMQGAVVLDPSPEDQIRLNELQQMRERILQLVKEGRGPKENPVVQGEYLYFASGGQRIDGVYYDKRYVVLGPEGLSTTREIPAEADQSELNYAFTWAAMCDLAEIHSLLKNYLEQQG